MKKSLIISPVLAVALLGGGMFNAHLAQAEQIAQNKNAVTQESAEKSRSALTPTQRAEMHTLMQASREKTQPLRASLFVKQQELKALQNAATPDVNAVSKTATQIAEIRGQLQQEKQSLGLAMDKTLGLEPGTSARKMHKKMRGHGNSQKNNHGNFMAHNGHGNNQHKRGPHKNRHERGMGPM